MIEDKEGISRRCFLGLGAAAAVFPATFGSQLFRGGSDESTSRRGVTHRGIMNDYLLYVGTYTNRTSKGIYAFHFSTKRGELTPIGLMAETVNPSFLALSPNKRFLHAVGEVKEYEGKPSGFVRAYSVDHRSGGLGLLGSTSSEGTGPCHVAFDNTGTFVAMANYVGGSVAVFRLLKDGNFGELVSHVQHSAGKAEGDASRRPHAHGAFFSNDNRFVVVPDLGLNKLFVYSFDQRTGVLQPADSPYVNLPEGSGPRHFAFHPSGKYAYVINEKGSTIVAFEYDGARAKLREIQSVSTLPDHFGGTNSTAEIQIDAGGKFLYASNRGADDIVVFAIAADGSLRLIEHVPAQGRTPRHFTLDPSEHWLIAANQDTDNIVVFRRDASTGQLAGSGQQVAVSSPVCLVFAPVR